MRDLHATEAYMRGLHGLHCEAYMAYMQNVIQSTLVIQSMPLEHALSMA